MQTVAYDNYFSKLATAFLKPNDITVMEEKLSHNKLSTHLNLIRTLLIEIIAPESKTISIFYEFKKFLLNQVQKGDEN